MLDEQIATAWSVDEKSADLFQRLRIHLAAFRRTRWAPTASCTVGPGTGRILHIHFHTSNYDLQRFRRGDNPSVNIGR